MDYVNIPFPDCIALGAQSAVRWSTTITQSFGGRVDANQNWQDPLHPFDISFAVRTVSEFALVKAHFMQVRGRANSFPFKDYTDFEVSASEGVILDAAGVAPAGNATFYLNKRYGSGLSAYDRPITRPDSPVQVFRTRSAVTTDITGSGAVVNYSSGAVAITGHMSGDTYSWAGEFHVPCRYDTDNLPAVIVNRQPNGEHLVAVTGLQLIEVRE
jgi:uncharacterized protein (TIGR02217 family)